MTRADAERYRAGYLAELMLKNRPARNAQRARFTDKLSREERATFEAMIAAEEAEKDRRWPSCGNAPARKPA